MSEQITCNDVDLMVEALRAEASRLLARPRRRDAAGPPQRAVPGGAPRSRETVPGAGADRPGQRTGHDPGAVAMTGLLVVADDGQGASVVAGAVYDDAATGTLGRDVDEYGWSSRGVTPHWTRAGFHTGQSGRRDPARASSRALG